MAINSWSHSKLVDFEKCKFLCYLKHDQRVPEPERPLPPGKTEHANDRGSRVHNEAEEYVNGSFPTPPTEAGIFTDHLSLLRVLHAEGKVSLEGEWGLDDQWNPTEWRTAWHRSKLDAIVHHSPTEATVIDYKTGRKFGNEIKHGEQMILYQLNAFIRFPLLERVTTELWYFDQGESTVRSFTRQQGLMFQKNWDSRGRKLTSCTNFPANPNVHSCKWCGYGPWGTGHCEKGIKK